MPLTRSTLNAVTSDSDSAAAGGPGYTYVVSNKSSHELNLQFVGNANGKTTATDAVDFSEGVSTAVVMVAPPKDHSVGFNLIQKNPIVGAPSVYTYKGESNDGNECQNMSTPSIGDGKSVRVEIYNAGFWGIGYTGTMFYPNGQSCNFRMLTQTEATLAGQPTWAKVLEIAGGVIVVCAVIYFAAPVIAGALGFGAEGAGMVVMESEVGSISSEESLSEEGLKLLEQLRARDLPSGGWTIGGEPIPEYSSDELLDADTGRLPTRVETGNAPPKSHNTTHVKGRPPEGGRPLTKRGGGGSRRNTRYARSSQIPQHNPRQRAPTRGWTPFDKTRRRREPSQYALRALLPNPTTQPTSKGAHPRVDAL